MQTGKEADKKTQNKRDNHFENSCLTNRQTDIPYVTVVEAVCGCEDPSVIEERTPAVHGGEPDSTL